jgi:hypothetical protein
MRPSLFVLALLLLPSALALDAGPVGVDHQQGPCEYHGGAATGLWTVRTGDTTLYIDDRDYVSGEGIWEWIESNGEPGLQRGYESGFEPDWGAGCVDSSNPDTEVDLVQVP